MRCLERTRINHCVVNGDFKKLVCWVNDSEAINFNFELKGDTFELYKNGEKMLTNIKNSDDGSIQCKTSSYSSYPEKAEKMSLSVFLDNPDKYVKNQEEYFKHKGRNDFSEKEFQFRLSKSLTVNNSAKRGFYSIIPEYIQSSEDYSRADLIIIDYVPDGKSHFSLVEVKRGYQSLSSKNDGSGIRKHLQDYTSFLDSNRLIKTMINDAELVFMQKAELGIIPGLDADEIARTLDVDFSKTDIMFVLADVSEDDEVLTEECEGIEWEKYVDYPIEFAFVDSSDCDYEHYRRESIREFSKRWITQK